MVQARQQGSRLLGLLIRYLGTLLQVAAGMQAAASGSAKSNRDTPPPLLHRAVGTLVTREDPTAFTP